MVVRQVCEMTCSLNITHASRSHYEACIRLFTVTCCDYFDFFIDVMIDGIPVTPDTSLEPLPYFSLLPLETPVFIEVFYDR